MKKTTFKLFRAGILLLFVLTVFGFTKTAFAETLSYDGKNVEYNGAYVKFTLDGKSIKGATGLILDNGTALAPCNKVFIASGMDITYKYSKAKGKLYLYHGSDVIKFTLGEKYAYVNDVKKELGAPARIIKQSSTGKSLVYVPSRFVATNFGFEYEWDKTTSTVSMKTPPLKLTVNKKTVNYTGVKVSVSCKGTEVTTKDYFGLKLDAELDELLVPAKLTFAGKKLAGCAYTNDSKSKTVTLSRFGNTLVMKYNSTMATLNGEEYELLAAPVVIKFSSTKKNVLYIPFESVCEALGLSGYVNEEDLKATLDVPYSISVNGKYLFPEVKGRVSYEGNEIVVDPYFSVIENNTALIRAKKIFATTMGLVYNYDEASKTVLFMGNDNVVIMTIDSTEAYVNGNLVTLETPPRLIRFDGATADMVMVPGRFTANSLGYDYEWDSANSMSKITIHKEKEDEDDDPYKDDADDSDVPGEVVDYDPSSAKDIFVADYRTGFTWNYNGSLLPSGADINSGNYIKSVNGYTNGYAYTIEFECTGKFEYALEDVYATNMRFVLRGGKSLLDPETFRNTDSSSSFTSIYNMAATDNEAVFVVNKTETANYYVTESDNKIRLIFMESKMPENVNVKIPFIPGTDISRISDEDDYFNNRFVFVLPGDQMAFLDANPVVNTNSLITSITKELNKDGDTVVVLKCKKLQTYKLGLDTDGICLQTGSPRDVYKYIVVLDAGHGGKDPGAQYHGKNEKDLNLAVAYGKMDQFFVGSDIKAYYTRKDDTFMELADRAKFADKMGADMFVSIHMNALPSNTSIYGTSVYYSSSNKSKMNGVMTSAKMAGVFQYDLTTELGMNDKNKRDSALYVTKNNTVPAVLIELGFMTNKTEFNKLADPEFQTAAAANIYGSIKYIFDTYGTER